MNQIGSSLTALILTVLFFSCGISNDKKSAEENTQEAKPKTVMCVDSLTFKMSYCDNLDTSFQRKLPSLKRPNNMIITAISDRRLLMTDTVTNEQVLWNALDGQEIYVLARFH